MPGTRQVDKLVPIVALHGIVPSASVPRWISLKGYNHVTIMITFKNATGVTGSAIALQQATTVAGVGAKALSFDTCWAVVDDSTSVVPVATAVVGGTFTTDPTSSKTGWYMIELDASKLDVNNGYDCIQATTGNGTAVTIEVTYWLSGTRFGGASYGYSNPTVD